MHIIPVIDLLNGIVVHAKKGARQHYQPIQSQLCLSHQPLDVVEALLDLYPFTQLYIADLNAIQKLNGTYTTNYDVISAVQQRFPALTLWVDAGISCNTELEIWQKLNVRLIIGSENFTHIGNFSALKNKADNFILSLDFFAHGYAGPAELLENTEYWPQDVIVMTLGNVGANSGVNSKLLNEVLVRAKGFNLYAAGGVRNIEDLNQLKAMGLQGALIATALHQQQLSIDDIEYFSQHF